MAQITQQEQTTLKTGLTKRTIRDAIDFMDPMDTPVLDFFGIKTANGFEFMNEPGTKLEWWNDEFRNDAGTLELAATAASTATALTLASTGGAAKVGDILLIGSEKLWVSAVGTDGLTATVTRGFGDSTAASLTTGAAYTIVGRARVEGADADYGPLEVPTSQHNYTQIYEYSLHMSRNAQREQQFGIASEWDYQAAKKMPEFFRDLERNLYYGERVLRVANTTPGGSGGLKTFITTNTGATAAASITIGDLQTKALAAYNDGAMLDTMIINPATTLTITDLYQNTNYLWVERSEDTVGMAIKRVQTPWFNMRLLESRYVPTTDLYMISGGYIGFYEYEAPFWQDLGITGDGRKAEMIAEYALVVRNEKHHVYINLA